MKSPIWASSKNFSVCLYIYFNAILVSGTKVCHSYWRRWYLMGTDPGCTIFSGTNCYHTYARCSRVGEFSQDEHPSNSGKRKLGILIRWIHNGLPLAWGLPGLTCPSLVLVRVWTVCRGKAFRLQPDSRLGKGVLTWALPSELR